MPSSRLVLAACLASALLVFGSIASATAWNRQTDDSGTDRSGRRDAKSDVKVLNDDLSSPKGVAVDEDGDLVIGQGAFGPPGPVLSFARHGAPKGTTEPLTDEPLALVDVAVSPLDGTGWGIGPDEAEVVHLYHQLPDGAIDEVLDLFAYQQTDPDPVDHDDPPNPTESNPYGLAIAPNGDAIVADAAGNDIIRVTPSGDATTIARFDLESVATDHLPADFPGGPLPPAIDAESVPTTVTFGPDGAIYVGELKGFPFRPGSSNIWRIEPDAENAWCSTDEDDPTGACSLFSTGYTAIQDIAFGKHGEFYVYELAAGGVVEFEAALDPMAGAPFPAAVLLKVTDGHKGETRTELAAGQLSQPGGVVVVGNKVYVTDSVFTGGRLLQVDNHGGQQRDGTDVHDGKNGGDDPKGSIDGNNRQDTHDDA